MSVPSAGGGRERESEGAGKKRQEEVVREERGEATLVGRERRRPGAAGAGAGCTAAGLCCCCGGEGCCCCCCCCCCNGGAGGEDILGAGCPETMGIGVTVRFCGLTRVCVVCAEQTVKSPSSPPSPSCSLATSSSPQSQRPSRYSLFVGHTCGGACIWCCGVACGEEECPLLHTTTHQKNQKPKRGQTRCSTQSILAQECPRPWRRKKNVPRTWSSGTGSVESFGATECRRHVHQ